VLGSPRINRFISSARLGPVIMRGTLGKKATLTNLKAMQDTFAATDPSARAGFYRAMAVMDLREGLADVDVPVVVISGTRDGLVAHKNSRRLAEAIKGATFEAIPDAGHMLPLETPEALADHLEGLAARSSTPVRRAANA
jgi:pimeloyl-ACP methyl ester carboxylesterase